MVSESLHKEGEVSKSKYKVQDKTVLSPPFRISFIYSLLNSFLVCPLLFLRNSLILLKIKIHSRRFTVL